MGHTDRNVPECSVLRFKVLLYIYFVALSFLQTLDVLYAVVVLVVVVVVFFFFFFLLLLLFFFFSYSFAFDISVCGFLCTVLVALSSRSIDDLGAIAHVLSSFSSFYLFPIFTMTLVLYFVGERFQLCHRFGGEPHLHLPLQL